MSKKQQGGKVGGDEIISSGLIKLKLIGAGHLINPSRGKPGREYEKSEFKIIKVLHLPTDWSITDTLFLYPDPGRGSVGKIIYVKPEKNRNWKYETDEEKAEDRQ